jgi:hypothetical protein
MIVFDLQCGPHGHKFEGWFASSADFARQQERGLVSCPTCASVEVFKAVMAPNVGRKGNQMSEPRKTPPPPAAAPAMTSPPPLPPEAVEVLRAIVTAQAEALKSSRWVGGDFAETARAIHYGEQDAEPIHGQARPEEVRELLEDGVQIAPILFPVIPPEQTN